MSTEDDRSGWWTYIETGLSRKGWTASQLADKAGYDASNLSNWKVGRSSPRPEQIRSTTTALGLDYIHGLVLNGYLTEDDLGIQRVIPDLDKVPDDVFWPYVAARLVRRNDEDSRAIDASTSGE